MTIPQFKVLMDKKASDAVSTVLNSGYIGQGVIVNQFEEALKQKLDFDYGVTVNSATSGLTLALHLAGVGPDDEVISTPMTCSATNEPIVHRGAKVVWADVDIFGNISPESVERKITDKTKAVIAVDWGGLPCDYDALREVIPDGIPIIEDAAHAFMATYKGVSVARAGGDYVVYSFQAIKHLTTGDGGLLVVPAEQYERAKLLRWYGLDRESQDGMRCLQDITEAGYKFHMNDINAAIGLANLEVAEWGVAEARMNAKAYNECFVGDYLPHWPRDRESSFWLYTMHVRDNKSFITFMEKCGVSVSKTHRRNDDFSIFLDRRSRPHLNSLEMFYPSMICIPVGWWLDASDVSWIVDCIFEWNKNHQFKSEIW